MTPPPIDRYLVRLRPTEAVQFHFLHGAVLRGLVSRALGEHGLPEGVVPAAAESGRVRFEAGEAYQLGLTLVGEDRALAGRLLAGLERLGTAPVDRAAPPTLGGNFLVESAEAVGAPAVEAEVAALAGAEALTLEWLSPLRLERPPDLKVRGAAYLNSDCFPPAHFLERLAARVRRFAGAEPAAGEVPPVPPELLVEAEELLWVDLPVPGAPGKARPYTLGGVLGRIRLAGVPGEWLPWIVSARHCDFFVDRHHADLSLAERKATEGIATSGAVVREESSLQRALAERKATEGVATSVRAQLPPVHGPLSLQSERPLRALRLLQEAPPEVLQLGPCRAKGH